PVHGFALSKDNGVPSQFGTFPAFVAIHGKIATDHRGNDGSGRFYGIPNGGQIFGSSGRRSIAPVGDRMNQNVSDPEIGGFFDQSNQMILVTMDAAIRNQTDEMEPGRFGRLKGFADHWIGGQISVKDRLVDPGKILVNDSSRTEIEASHFRIPHVAFGQYQV